MEKDNMIAEFKDAIEKTGFYTYISKAHDDGRLKAILPDIDKLFTVSEKRDDGCVYTVSEQMLSVLEKGDQLSGRCKYALLTYNVSKSCTSERLLPTHPINYGNLSVGIIDRISTELKMPDEYNEFAMMFARYHTLMHNPDRMNNSEAYDLVKKCGEIHGQSEFFSCVSVYMGNRAACSKDSSYVDICAHKCEERLRAVFADVKSGNDARYMQAKVDKYRELRGF